MNVITPPTRSQFGEFLPACSTFQATAQIPNGTLMEWKKPTRDSR